MSFVRRFDFDPGNDILLEIESINILDISPPAAIAGIGSGVALMVGEFEDGAFDLPIEVESATDVRDTFGQLGYTYGSVGAQYPCAVARQADSASVPEYWNGNGAVQMNGKAFSRLILCRADTSVGSVQFTARTYLTGSDDTLFDLEPNQVLELTFNATTDSATFTATAATVTSGSQTFPTLFAGGETLVLGYDAASNFTTTFTSGDQTQAQVISRINAAAGFTFAVSVSGTTMSLTGIQRGSGAEVRVISGSSGVLTTLGLSAATTNGTGNVADIDAVTHDEVKTVVEAGIASSLVETDSTGALRVSNLLNTGVITVTANTTALNLGFVPLTVSATAPPTVGKIPAGTIVQNTAATRVFVTMQTVVFGAGGVTIAGETFTTTGPWTVPVRHAVDDGTGSSASAGTVVEILTPLTAGSFTVDNAANIDAALSEASLDQAYADAMDATLDQSNVAKEANILWCARQSNRIRRDMRSNVRTASAGSTTGRLAIIRTPLNTLKATAKGASEPGVQAYRDRRVIYVYPQVKTFVPPIAVRGLSGGAGFTADGNVDIGADGFLASICSQLPPEENPGQQTAFTSGALGLESGDNAKGFTINDYIAFKAAGICAPIFEDGVLVYQSGVTSVDPSTDPGLVNIQRQRMADYIGGTLANAGRKYGKKLQTAARRATLVGSVRAFLEGLLSREKPENQRIDGYTLVTGKKAGNTDTTLGQGMYRIQVKVRTLSSFLAIVFELIAGEQVVVTQSLPQAA